MLLRKVLHYPHLHHTIVLHLVYYSMEEIYILLGNGNRYKDIVQQFGSSTQQYQYSATWAKQNEVHGYYKTLIERKTRLALELGLGGVMILGGCSRIVEYHAINARTI